MAALYKEIYEKLKHDIQNGLYQIAEAFPPERQLKDKFSTSHITIRKSLALLVEEGFLERKPGSGTIVCDPNNKAAKKGLKSVIFLVGNLDQFYAKLLNELTIICQNLELSVEVLLHQNNSLLERQLYELSVDREDCIILWNPIKESYPDLIFTRTILIDSNNEMLKVPQLCANDMEMAFLATKHLTKKGTEGSVGHISSNRRSSGRLRQQGFEEALSEMGVKAVIANGSYTIEGGYFACEEILTKDQSCRRFFCANDLSAMGAIRFLKKKGLVLNVDYQMVSIANLDFAELLSLNTFDHQIPKWAEQIGVIIQDFLIDGQMSERIYLISAEEKIYST